MVTVEDAALGAALGFLLQAIKEAKEKAVFFRRTLQSLQDTLQNVKPIIHEVLKIENAPTDACNRFVLMLKKAKVLVEMYSDISKRKLLKKRKVKKLIQEMDASIQRFMIRDFQAEQLLYLAKINEKMDRVIESFGLDCDAVNGKEFNNETAANGKSSNPKTENESGGCSSNPKFEFRWKSEGKFVDIRFSE
ncbi:uncharacterized protein LOC110627281 [Manihot esculenta]|uniref:RPW8 domain-containing protein n=1 Tax=Manihot esculenta TaxID=3983 RepID=A0A2C9UV78_MANES|nr:uncharacterized protein LOC110627281 [Manihot esculenta]OAY35353.1 hypothetical protein MANES_12G094300v8 [Manihot esculenta]